MTRKKTAYPYTDPTTGFIHVTPWVTLDFYWDKIVKDVRKEPWEEDPENSDQELRTLFLGSSMPLCPSGKFYTPFACSNLNPCPVCGGTDKVKSRYSRRVVRRAKNRSSRQRRLWVKRYSTDGGGWRDWPQHIVAKSAELNRYMRRFDTKCPRCTEGSHEAKDDEDFFEALENKLEELGLFLLTNDGDCWAAESRSVDVADEADVP